MQFSGWTSSFHNYAPPSGDEQTDRIGVLGGGKSIRQALNPANNTSNEVSGCHSLQNVLSHYAHLFC